MAGTIEERKQKLKELMDKVNLKSKTLEAICILKFKAMINSKMVGTYERNKHGEERGPSEGPREEIW
jgi:hypothetical protein